MDSRRTIRNPAFPVRGPKASPFSPDPLHQQVHGSFGALIPSRIHGGQRAQREHAFIDVVEVDHGHVLWHPKTLLREPAQGAEGQRVIEGKDGVEPDTLAAEVPDRRGPRVPASGSTAGHQIRIEGNARRRKRLAVTALARLSGCAGAKELTVNEACIGTRVGSWAWHLGVAQAPAASIKPAATGAAITSGYPTEREPTAASPITVFPVWTAGAGRLGISTGLDADVPVSELTSGARVGNLTIRNNGKNAALLLEGELLEGGQQHRTCARDVLVGPCESRDIETFCVEAGRWQAGQSIHSRLARRAPLNVMAELAYAGSTSGRDSQAQIWERVRRFDAARGPSATNSLPEHLDRFGREAQHCSAPPIPEPLEGQRGVVIGIVGKPLLLEVFGTAILFRRHYRQLIEAVLRDAELLPASARNAAPMPGQAARDLAAIAGPMDFGEFYGSGDVRRHDTMRSRNINGTRGPVCASGITVVLPNRAPEIVHVSYWNTNHFLMETS